MKTADIVRVVIISILCLVFLILLIRATIHLIKEVVEIKRFRKRCTEEVDAAIVKVQLSGYKGGKYKHRDAKCKYRFQLDGEDRVGSDKYSGFHNPRKVKENDVVRIMLDPSDTKYVYGYYTRRKLNESRAYLIDFLFIDAVLLTAVVVCLVKIISK